MENSVVKTDKMKVNSSILIIGGGIAGIETAIRVANRGIKVLLIERGGQLGGILRNINSFYSIKEKPIDFINKRVQQTSSNPNIKVLTNTLLVDVDGLVGDFTVYLHSNGEKIKEKVGAIVIATGLQSIFCPVKYNLGISDNVVGQLKLENMLVSNKDFNGKRVTLIVGKTTENYQLSFVTALKNAIVLTEKGSSVNLFYRNMKVAADELEALYTKARDIGINFYKFDNNIEINSKDNNIIINYEDPFLKGKIPGNYQVTSDLIVLPEELLPAEGTDELGKLLRVSIGHDFLGEDNVHILPEYTSREGIYLVGSSHSPCIVPEIELDAEVVAGEIYKLLTPEEHDVVLTQPYVVPEKCVVCLTCYRCCPHDAITIVHDDSFKNLYKSAAQMNPLACKRCGICAAECPGKAIQLPYYTDDEILAQLEAMEV